MKLEHEFFDLQELEKRWSEYGLTEKDILKYGVSGKLQFSIFPPNSPIISRIAQLHNTNEYLNGETVICSENVDGGNGSIYNISIITVKNIFHAESNYAQNGIPSEVELELEIPCPEPKCKFPNRATCWLEYCLLPHPGASAESRKGFTCNRFDLIVTHKNELAFEETYLKPEPEEQKPPYLDPDNEFYSVTLDLAVRAWKVIFEEKKHLDKNSAGKAGSAYLRSPESGCTELLQKFDIELTPTLADNIAKVAAGEYSPNKSKWNRFCKRNK